MGGSGHSLHGLDNMVAIGSTVKDRALGLRVRFGASPESARRRAEKVGFPTNWRSSTATTIRLRRGRPRAVWAECWKG
jgi:hypothetical protein